jgi:hypothetical protein
MAASLLQFRPLLGHHFFSSSSSSSCSLLTRKKTPSPICFLAADHPDVQRF